MASVFFQTACINGSQRVSKESGNAEPTQEKSQQDSFSGKYSNVIPCADCPGIETTVSFNADSTFIENMKYLERNSSFSDTGRWRISNKIIMVSFPSKSSLHRFYRIKSDSVIAILDADKKEIKGALTNNYLLKKLK